MLKTVAQNRKCQQFALSCCPWYIKKYGATFSMSLPIVHALTGYDSTSSFTGIDKKTAFKILQTKISDLQPLYDLEDLVEIQMNSDAVNNTIKFVIWLYDKTADTNQINEIRYKLFAQKNSNTKNLPPTEDALIQHTRRVSYQVFIWKWLICHHLLEMDGKNKTDIWFLTIWPNTIHQKILKVWWLVHALPAVEQRSVDVAKILMDPQKFFYVHKILALIPNNWQIVLCTMKNMMWL